LQTTERYIDGDSDVQRRLVANCVNTCSVALRL